MSRENQNQVLQAAVVIFAMLSVVLGVTVFLLARRGEEFRHQARDCLEEAARNQALARSAREEAGELKSLAGFAAGEKIEVVRGQAAQEMQSCAALLPEVCRSYRPAVTALQDVVRDRTAELAQAKEEIKTWQEAYARLEASKDGKIERYGQVAARANAEQRATEAATRDARTVMLNDTEGFRREMLRTQKQADEAVANARKRADDLDERLLKVIAERDKHKNQLDDLHRENFSVADGRIQRVSAQMRMAWIDLGYADALRRFLPFNVYPAAATKLNPANMKGKIEVTRVLDEHLAEARIVDDKPASPLAQGDKIHSPGWRAP